MGNGVKMRTQIERIGFAKRGFERIFSCRDAKIGTRMTQMVLPTLVLTDFLLQRRKDGNADLPAGRQVTRMASPHEQCH